ncbi:MAG TPA: cytochrome c3 family protein [Candidatus Sulfotelmatobacter sp.]|nr:cytochrome c3 family protein [Candidatus Sulfotelmatobacter sp.]
MIRAQVDYYNYPSMRHQARVRILTAFLLLTGSSWAVEHPGIVTKDAECSSCHANKLTGKSVHSAMETTCAVCHVAATQGDMMTVRLSMPKEKICSACHDERAALRQHMPPVRGSCVDCHDAHSSDRTMLLRNVAQLSIRKKK